MERDVQGPPPWGTAVIKGLGNKERPATEEKQEECGLGNKGRRVRKSGHVNVPLSGRVR